MKKFAVAMICGALAMSATAFRAQDNTQPGDAGGRTGQRRGGGFGRGGMMGGQRVMGVVQSVSDKSVTVKDEDGTLWTVDTTDNTRVMKEREPAKFADITKGQAVMAMGMPEGDKKELHAGVIAMLSAEQAQRIAEQAARMKENLGKTYLTGRITRIDETKITIVRPDKVEQVAVVDENTMLRRGGAPNIGEGMAFGRGPGAGGRRGTGAPAADAAPNTGEPITLADLKVGDAVIGPGSMKDGSFLFKELHLMAGRQGGQRRAASQQ